ncbi:MAG: ATP-binding protein [Bacilli bacterium]|nr:ATP-binding protein [Bacilli bacterium]
MEQYRKIEKSIIKKFRKQIWRPFINAINDYQLIKPNDKIAVCISGGKDSMLLAKCMQELKRHGQISFELIFLLMDPGYDQKDINIIKTKATELNIPLTIFKTDIFKVLTLKKHKSPCYLCARMRRGHLYNKAQELGCNKIALAHHFNDVIETTLLNILYNGQFETMMPKLKSEHFQGMELIRPFYYVKELDIINWTHYNNLQFMECGCEVTKKQISNKRQMIKQLIKELTTENKNADINILHASENVNLNAIIGYHQDKETHHFLDNY